MGSSVGYEKPIWKGSCVCEVDSSLGLGLGQIKLESGCQIVLVVSAVCWGTDYSAFVSCR